MSYYSDETVTLHHGDALDVLRTLETGSIDCCVTSPPYFGLRSYGDDDEPNKEAEIGTEETPAEFVERLRALFSEIRRVLADDGTCWLNLGDSYVHSKASGPQGLTGQRVGRAFTALGAGGTASMPDKNLIGIPWRVAFALQEDGWILRNEIIWLKTNGMPDSALDRMTVKHEQVFLLTKKPRYWFDLDPIREEHITGDRPITDRDLRQKAGSWAVGAGTRNRSSGPEGVGRNEKGKNPGDVWAIATTPFPGPHWAVMPIELAERCILAGCKPGGTVLDPCSGSGTTGMAALKHGRKYIGVDLYAKNLDLSLRTRLHTGVLDFDGGAA